MLDTLEQALRQAAAFDAPFGCCLLYGEERYPYGFLQSGLNYLIKQGHTVEVYDAAAVKFPELMAALSSSSFFSPQKIIHLKNPHRYSKKDLEKLIKWLDLQSKNKAHKELVVTSLFMSSVKLDGRSILVSRLKKLKIPVVKCVKLKPREVVTRLNEKLLAAKVSADTAALNAMVSLHEENLTLLEQELEKMIIFVGPGGRIEREVFALLGIDGGGGNIFTFCDALSEGRFADALVILDILLRARTETLLIVSMIARQYRLLSRASSPELAKSPAAELTKVLKVHPFVAKKLTSQSKRLSPKGYAQVFMILHDADIAVKTSRFPHKIILENIVLKIAKVR